MRVRRYARFKGKQVDALMGDVLVLEFRWIHFPSEMDLLASPRFPLFTPNASSLTALLWTSPWKLAECTATFGLSHFGVSRFSVGYFGAGFFGAGLFGAGHFGVGYFGAGFFGVSLFGTVSLALASLALTPLAMATLALASLSLPKACTNTKVQSL